VESLAMSHQLSVPFETFSTQFTGIQTSCKMAALDVYYQITFTTELGVTDVTDELL